MPKASDLPPPSDEIVADNLRAAALIYAAAMLEELRLFQVVARLVELFALGRLPIGRGSTAEILYAYWRDSAQRLTEPQRRSVYARVMGTPSGDTGGASNREFDDLWRRFLAAVSAYARQLHLQDGTAAPAQDDVRRKARDLAVNLSRHADGLALHVAADLRAEIDTMVRILSDPEIRGAFGATDMWQVIDKVADLELGGARDSKRYRTLADSGSTIIRWLASKRQKLLRLRPARILDDAVIRKRRIAAGRKPPLDPTDYELVAAAEAWLAASAT